MRLLVYNTEGKIFGNFSMHVETQSAGPQNKTVYSSVTLVPSVSFHYNLASFQFTLNV